MGRHISEVESRLRDYLRRPEQSAGDKLPGERDLALALGVGRTALRPALKALEDEGVIRRHARSGAVLVSIPAPAGRGATIAVVAPLQIGDDRIDGNEPWWIHRVVSTIERVASAAGAEVVLYDQSPLVADPCSVKDLAIRAAHEGAQAVILLHAVGARAKTSHALAVLHDKGVHPIIISSRSYPGLASQVYFDSGWGTYLAVRHVLEHGHTRIGFVGGSSGHEWVRDRLAGYRSALEAADIEASASWIVADDEGERAVTPADGAAALRHWRALPADERPTAIIAANDILAEGVLAEADALGLSLPGDFSLVGFDNDPAAMRLGLTTIERPTETLGDAVARTVLERLAAGPEAESVTLRLRPVLIPRKTVGPPPK
ncbi:MAG: substrate-binding domain-containing protein [Capsulimonas sp.]|uniref:substrate-binding domain-containing protein n=1 Tax=Capsulimonas sp. TaxID=2494211 RepID=UPI0032643A31